MHAPFTTLAATVAVALTLTTAASAEELDGEGFLDWAEDVSTALGVGLDGWTLESLPRDVGEVVFGQAADGTPITVAVLGILETWEQSETFPLRPHNANGNAAAQPLDVTGHAVGVDFDAAVMVGGQTVFMTAMAAAVTVERHGSGIGMLAYAPLEPSTEAASAAGGGGAEASPAADLYDCWNLRQRAGARMRKALRKANQGFKIGRRTVVIGAIVASFIVSPVGGVSAGAVALSALYAARHFDKKAARTNFCNEMRRAKCPVPGWCAAF